MIAPTRTARRIRLRVDGVVQGVGFRPFVYRLASELGLGGFVRNAASHVEGEFEGTPDALDELLVRIRKEAPPMSQVERIDHQAIAVEGASRFEICASVTAGAHDVRVAPDAATCAECVAELFDRANRRFRYPFTNCTNCGPRFTIVQRVPYDRPNTTMAGFVMCPECAAEYHDPGNRRFHAQPNACPACGPALRLVRPDGRDHPDGATDAVRAAADALIHGAIVAVKGLGGYHLACRADDASAVRRLRARKHRDSKPFALMVADVAAARRLVHLAADDATLLSSRQRPIVLAPRLPDANVADAVAPEVGELGVMLPYTPLHHLLLADASTALVMTSGNRSDEPIAYRDGEALTQLRDIADFLLVHDRPIETRTDDSVVRTVRTGTGRATQMVRRSRGYVPDPIRIPHPTPPLLACGALLKNTFCLATGHETWVSHHLGDLENVETLAAFESGVKHFERLLGVTPEYLVHDLHPDSLSTRYALDRGGAALIGIQHHHAHFAACLAEHRETGRAAGLIFDGAGYGTDGTIWGGEVLTGTIARSERVAHLLPVPMPGGDRATREPWRMTCAWLVAAFGEDVPPPPTLAGDVDAHRWRQVARLSRGGPHAPMTSSMGRLFDAAAALAGVAARVDHEGEAAIRFEALADPECDEAYPVACTGDALHPLIDPRPLFEALQGDVDRGTPAGRIAARFHNAIILISCDCARRAALSVDSEVVVLSGGVFQNRVLLEGVSSALSTSGFRVLHPRLLPPNDGGISYGQAAAAAALLAEGR